MRCDNGRRGTSAATVARRERNVVLSCHKAVGLAQHSTIVAANDGDIDRSAVFFHRPLIVQARITLRSALDIDLRAFADLGGREVDLRLEEGSQLDREVRAILAAIVLVAHVEALLERDHIRLAMIIEGVRLCRLVGKGGDLLVAVGELPTELRVRDRRIFAHILERQLHRQRRACWQSARGCHKA